MAAIRFVTDRQRRCQVQSFGTVSASGTERQAQHGRIAIHRDDIGVAPMRILPQTLGVRR
jgi:hypothetical protein